MAALRCASCGEQPPDDARFCPRCGTPVITTAATAAPPAPVVDPLLGQVVAGRYLLVESVGQGASGVVYRAEHKTLHKRVAVKVLHPHLSSDDAAIERFRREATTVSALDNEHILQVLDFGRTDDKRLFFAMEYVEGTTLDALITPAGEHGKGHGLDIARVVNIVEQTGEALSESHALGYIHRDLRPRNIFLTTKRGRPDFVKLLDFGLAKLVSQGDSAARQTALGMTFGDPRYMAPEQIRGAEVDGRTDVYALALITFEALTGHAPFAAPNPIQVVELHLKAPVPSVRASRADCPQWLDEVVERALAKQPADRFASMRDFVTALRTQRAGAAAEPVPVAATPASAATPDAAAPIVPAASSLPSVIVDDWEAPAAGTPAPTPASATTGPMPAFKDAPQTTRRDESSGEWFQQKGPSLATAGFEDDIDELPAPSRMPLYIAVGLGGLVMAVVLTLALWPHPPRVPLRGEVVPAAATPLLPASAPPTAPTPIAPSAAPAVAVAAPVSAPSAPAAAPSVAPVVAAHAVAQPPALVPSAAIEHHQPVTPPPPAPEPKSSKHPAAAPPTKRDKHVAANDEKDFPTSAPAADKKAPPPARSETKESTQNNAVQAEFFVKLGRQKLGASDLSAAAANFSKAREYDPRSADAVAGLGEVAFEQGDYNGAAVHLKQALRMSPDRPRYLVLLGQAFYKLGRPKDAVNEYKRALHSDPNNQEAQRSLDVAEKKLND